MIVTTLEDGRDDGRLRLVTQHDHAHLAGRILSLWRADGLPEHPRREAILVAGREHDNGWREEDSAPRLDPETDQPVTFFRLPTAARIEVWDRSTSRMAESHPYAALLIARHALFLHEDRRGESPAWDTLFALLEARVDDLLETTGADLDQVREDYRLLHLADLVSLGLAAGWTELVERMGTRVDFVGPDPVDGSLTARLDPFPLAGATSFRLACRHLPARPYRSTADLADELLAAHWESLPVRLAPLSEG